LGFAYISTVEIQMTITQCGQLLATLIQNYMGLAAGRVVLKNEGFDAPKDAGIYVLVEYDGAPDMVGVNSHKDYTADTEKMSSVVHERFAIEVISRGPDATNRHKEVLFALRSIAAIRAMEDNNTSVWRAGGVLDLSAIEGSGALRRYRIPVIMSNIESKTTTATMIDHFTTPTIAVEQ
jgi:hypothetical protein